MNRLFFCIYESHIKHKYPITNKIIINIIAPNLLDINNINNIPIAIKKAIKPIKCLKESLITATHYFVLGILYAFVLLIMNYYFSSGNAASIISSLLSSSPFLAVNLSTISGIISTSFPTIS